MTSSSTVTLFTEFDNQSALRAYPFTDTATMTDTMGARLPNDFITDIVIHPRDTGISGAVYMSAIDFTAGTITFSFALTEKVAGTVAFLASDTWAEILDPVFNDPMGIVSFGVGVTNTQLGGAVRAFLPEATELIPSTVFPITPAGVHGIQLPDGTIMRGDVLLQGVNGIDVGTLGGLGELMPSLRFDCVGPQAQVLEETGFITSICVSRTKDSLFILSDYADGVLALTPTIDIEGACGASGPRRGSATGVARTMDTFDPCVEPVPVDAPAFDPWEQCFAPNDGAFTITALSTEAFRNPISITTSNGTSSLLLPSASGGGIMLSFVSKL